MIERFFLEIYGCQNLNLANLLLAKKQNLNFNKNFLPVGRIYIKEIGYMYSIKLKYDRGIQA